jgi:hypothetical protein
MHASRPWPPQKPDPRPRQAFADKSRLRNRIPTDRFPPPSDRAKRGTRTLGEVAEWSNAPHSKCGIPVRVSRVRIPPSPPQPVEKIGECLQLQPRSPIRSPITVSVHHGSWRPMPLCAGQPWPVYPASAKRSSGKSGAVLPRNILPTRPEAAV